MTEHPNAKDYSNRAERNAAYWREEAAMMIEGSTEHHYASEMASDWADAADWFEAQADA